MAPKLKNDKALVQQARRRVGASDASAIPDEDIKHELESVRKTVTEEVRLALDEGDLDLYASDAPLEMARNLLYLRVAELKNKRGRGKGNGPKKPIPRNMGMLRRHKFEDRDLAYYRDEAIRHAQRINGNNRR